MALAEEDLKIVMQAFKSVDSDDSGLIESGQLSCLMRMLLPNCDDDAVHALVSGLPGATEGGRVQYRSWLEWLFFQGGLDSVVNQPRPRTVEGPKLVLHFAVNSVILVRDTAAGMDLQEALHHYLAGTCWGRVASGDESKSSTWLWSETTKSGRLSLSCPADAEINYLKHLSDSLGGSRAQCVLHDVELRLELQRWTESATGAVARPIFERLLRCNLSGNLRLSPFAFEQDGKWYHYILPSFWRMLAWLNDSGRRFALVLRTFGSDGPAVAEAIAAFARGEHPDFPRPCPSLMPADPISGRVLRSEKGVRLELPGRTLDDEGDIFCFFNQLKGTMIVNDDVEYWRSEGRIARGGKPLWCAIESDVSHVHHIFLDSASGPVDARLLAVNPLGGWLPKGSVNHASAQKAGCVARPALHEALEHREYFVNEVRQCCARFWDNKRHKSKLLEKGLLHHYDVVVLGGGPVGVKAAVEASSRGCRVAIVDPAAILSGAPTGVFSKCVREAVLQGATSIEDITRRVRTVVHRSQHTTARELRTFNVSVYHGTGQVVGPKLVRCSPLAGDPKDLRCEAIIIASGSRANRFPPVDFQISGVFDSDTISTLHYLPKSVMIQGAGIIGMEFALIFAKLGTKVVIVDVFDKVVPFLDYSLQDALLRALAEAGVEILLKTAIDSISEAQGHSSSDPALRVDIADRTFFCDCLLSACGRHGVTDGLGLDTLEPLGLKIGRGRMVEVDEDCWTGVGRVYAVGDVAGANLATAGQAQAIRAVRTCFPSGMVKKSQLAAFRPSVVWTIPEFAWVGLTEEEALARGMNAGEARVEYAETVRGAIGKTEGFLKLVYDRGSGKALGVHIFGPEAGHLVSYGADVVNDGDTIFGILGFVFPAVTYHELYHKAASEAKVRQKGARSIAASTAWRRLQRTLQKVLAGKGMTMDDVLETAFRMFDLDRSGFISVDELKKSLRSLGLHFPSCEVKEMITEATGDPSETNIDYGHFFRLLRCNWDPGLDSIASLRLGREYDLIVIGGGPVGVKAACEAGLRGQRVALIDPKVSLTGAPTGVHSKVVREAMLGGTEAWSEVEDLLDRTLDNSHRTTMRQLRTFRVEVLQGRGQVTGERTLNFQPADGQAVELACEVMIIATGSKSNRFPPIDFGVPGVFDSDTVATLWYKPRRVVIQGAGIIGMEYGQLFSGLGASVIIVETFDRAVPFLDASLQDALLDSLRNSGVEVLLSTPIKSVRTLESHTPSSPALCVEIDGRSFECDVLLSACGRCGVTQGLGLESLQPLGLKIGRGQMIEVDENCWTGVGRVYAVGDVVGANLATAGQAQAKHVIRKCYGSGNVSKLRGTLHNPSGVWTVPELAWVGLSEEAAVERGFDVGSARAEYAHTVRGCISSSEGFLKLVYDRVSGKALGVHIFGPNACELVNYGADVVNDGDTIFSMLQFVFPAVTYHQLYHFAASEAKRTLNRYVVGTCWHRLRCHVEASTKVSGSKLALREACERVFRLCDSTGNGALGCKELRCPALGLDAMISDEDAINMIANAAGKSGSQTITCDMFLTMLGVGDGAV